MKHTIFLISIVVTVLACKDSDSAGHASDRQEKEHAAKLTRQILIAELKQLRQITSSKDKNRIAGIFPFPLADTTVSVYVDDSIFNSQFEANGNRVTKSMFLNYFKEVSESISLNQVLDLLQRMPLDSLSFKDKFDRDAANKTEPCFYSYHLEVIEDSVVLRMDMKSNNDYKGQPASEEEMPENSSENCEHSFWWNFKFDGKRLHMQSIGGAD